MFLEVYIHLSQLESLFRGRPVNCKINYAGQSDIRLLLNPKKFVLVATKGSSNLVVVRKRKFIDRFRKKKVITL